MSRAFWRKVSRPAANRRLSRSSLAANCACADAGAGVFAEIEVLHLAIAFEHDELEVTQRVGLEGLQLVGARLQVVSDDVHAAQALEVHVAVGEDFVEGEEQAGLAVAVHLRADEAGEVAAEIDDLPGIGCQHLRLARCPGLTDGTVGGVGDGLHFEGGDGCQLLLRVAAELGADVGQRTVLPGLVDLQTGPDLALGYEPRGLADGVIGIVNATGQQRLRGLDGDFGLGRRRSRVRAPVVVAGRKAIHLRERALEAVALHFLHALFEDGCGERSAAAVGGREHLAARDDFRLEERRLVKEGVAVGVVAGDLEGDYVRAGLEFAGEVPLVHTVEAVRAASRTVAQEMAVEEDAIEGGARGSQQDLFLRRRFEAGMEADEQVLLRLAALRPDRLAGDEGRRGGRQIGAHQ